MTLTPDTTPADAPGLSIERWSANSSSERTSRASVVLHGGGHRWRAHATGNGAVDALMRAVDRALEPLLPDGVQLTTYEVRAIGQGHETDASVTVSVRGRDAADGPLYPGQAVHPNVLEASTAAYVDAVNTLLADRGVDISAMVPGPDPTDRHDVEHDSEVRSRTKSRIMSIYNS